MAERDMTEKELLSFNDVFADIVNNLVFQGKERIAETDLEQALNRKVYIGENGFREMERDVTKNWKDNDIRIATLGIENETQPENEMPIRVIGYDGILYRDQIRYETDAQGHRRKIVDLHPVVTLVLYFGYREHWNKARTLHAALGDKLQPELKELVSDYKINLYEIAYLTDEQLQGFKSDFKYVADYFVQKQRTGTYKGSLEEMKHVREVLQLLTALTGDQRFVSVVEPKEGAGKGIKEGEIHTMCDVLDAIEQKGIDKGIGIGFGQGDEARAHRDAFRMHQKGIPLEDIADIMDLNEDTILSWLDEMNDQ